jgi:hypothetical protein
MGSRLNLSDLLLALEMPGDNLKTIEMDKTCDRLLKRFSEIKVGRELRTLAVSRLTEDSSAKCSELLGSVLIDVIKLSDKLLAAEPDL